MLDSITMDGHPPSFFFPREQDPRPVEAGGNLAVDITLH